MSRKRGKKDDAKAAALEYGKEALKIYESVTHSEINANCSVVTLQIGDVTLLFIQRYRPGDALKCNCRAIDPTVFTFEPFLMTWAAGKVLDFECNKILLEARVASHKGIQPIASPDELMNELTLEATSHAEQSASVAKERGDTSRQISDIAIALVDLSQRVDSLQKQETPEENLHEKLSDAMRTEDATTKENLASIRNATSRFEEGVQVLDQENQKLEAKLRQVKAAISHKKKESV